MSGKDEEAQTTNGQSTVIPPTPIIIPVKKAELHPAVFVAYPPLVSVLTSGYGYSSAVQ
jgi:hypothetical protein